MLIYPAIDLLGGRCVRLKRGRFDDVTEYSADPFEQLARLAEGGASWIHVVDLDGAKAGRPCQHELIGRIASSLPVQIQAGGGVRNLDHVAALLDGGVARVVVGSLAVSNANEVQKWIAAFGMERICLAFDVGSDGGSWKVSVHGWQDSLELTLDAALALYPPGAARHVLITDISRDGMLTGANIALLRITCAARPDFAVQASGGIANLSDLTTLKNAGAAGAIVGRALYEGVFTLPEALRAG